MKVKKLDVQLFNNTDFFFFFFCSMQDIQTVIHYPLLLGGNERLEAGGDPEAQLMEKGRL